MPAESPIWGCMNKGISAEFQSHQTVINVADVGYFTDASIQSGFNPFILVNDVDLYNEHFPQW